MIDGDVFEFERTIMLLCGHSGVRIPTESGQVTGYSQDAWRQLCETMGFDYPFDKEESPKEEDKSIYAKIFDKSNPRYKPELAAAVYVWTSFEKNPTITEGFTTRQECLRRLNEWIKTNGATQALKYKLVKGSPTRHSAADRVLTMVNWEAKALKK